MSLPVVCLLLSHWCRENAASVINNLMEAILIKMTLAYYLISGFTVLSTVEEYWTDNLVSNLAKIIFLLNL